jgi:hypothetical protein
VARCPSIASYHQSNGSESTKWRGSPLSDTVSTSTQTCGPAAHRNLRVHAINVAGPATLETIVRRSPLPERRRRFANPLLSSAFLFLLLLPRAKIRSWIESQRAARVIRLARARPWLTSREVIPFFRFSRFLTRSVYDLYQPWKFWSACSCSLVLSPARFVK